MAGCCPDAQAEATADESETILRPSVVIDPATGSRKVVYSAMDATRPFDPAGRVPEEEEPEDIEFDIPEDAYGAATLAIVRDFQEAYRGNDVALNLTTGLFSLALNILNLTLQFLIVGYLQLYVVEPKVHAVQLLYRDYHALVFDAEGNFMPEQWDEFDRQASLCEIAMTTTGFYSVSLFLWWASMMKEFRTTWRLFLNIVHMPSCKRGLEMLRTKASTLDAETKALQSPKVHIVALTVYARFFLYFLVCLPKFIISSSLLWSGSEWLSATNKFEDLIMNAVAMTFVTHVDELLFEVLLPAAYREEVRAINFVVPCRRGPPQQVRNYEMWLGFRRSAMYVAIMLLGIFLYSHVLQDVLPRDVSDLRIHCNKFVEDIQPICSAGLVDRISAILVSGSATRKCYPYR